MRPHPRIRKMVSWTGVVLAALITLAWLATLRWRAQIQPGSKTWVFLEAGSVIRVECDNPASVGLLPSSRLDRGTGEMNVWFGHQHEPRVGFRLLAVPLCCPFVLVILPAVLAVRAYALAGQPAELCRFCRYSLAGLPAGCACPECGKSSKDTDQST